MPFLKLTKRFVSLLILLVLMGTSNLALAMRRDEDEIQNPGHNARPGGKRDDKVDLIDDRAEKKQKGVDDQLVRPKDPRWNSFLPNFHHDMKLLIVSYLDGHSAKATYEVCWNARELVKKRGRLVLKSENAKNLFPLGNDVIGSLKTLHIDCELKLEDCEPLSGFLDRCPQLLSLSLNLPVLEELEGTMPIANKISEAGPIGVLAKSISECKGLENLDLSAGRYGLNDYHCCFFHNPWKNLTALKHLSLVLRPWDESDEMNQFIFSLSSLPQLTGLKIINAAPNQEEVNSFGQALREQRHLRSFSFVCSDGDAPNHMATLIPLLNNNPNLLCFEIENCEMSYEFCTALTSLTQLKRLSLNNIFYVGDDVITPQHVEATFNTFLSGLRTLEEVDFAYYYTANNENTCVVPFASLPNLRKAEFSGISFSSKEIDDLLKLKNLKKVKIMGNNFNSELTPRKPSENPQLEITIYGKEKVSVRDN